LERRRRLERLSTRSEVACLRLVGALDDGERLLEVAERHGLEDVVRKRELAPSLRAELGLA
jgi:ATP-dependent DNA ligase